MKSEKYPNLSNAKLLDKRLKQAMDDLLEGKITAAEGDAIAEEANYLINNLEEYIQSLENDLELLEPNRFSDNAKKQTH